MANIDQYLDARQVASLLKISRAAAYRLMKQCEHVKQGRLLRVSERALRTFLERNTTRMTPDRVATPKRGTSLLRPIFPRTKARKDAPNDPKLRDATTSSRARPAPTPPLTSDRQAPETLLAVDLRTANSKRATDTLKMVEEWRMARDLRALAHEIRAILRSAELEMAKDGYSERLVRSLLEHADRIDPIALIRDDAITFGLGKLNRHERPDTPA